MSKKCPHCGSYNTEVSISNYAGRAVVNSGRAILAASAAVVTNIFSPGHGSHIGVETWKNTDPGDFQGYHCCNCGKDFSA